MNRAHAFLTLLTWGLAAGQPLQNRVLIARSTDGLTWERTGVIFCDSADVPEAVRGPDQRFYIYYQGLWTPYHDGIMVAISQDGISSWERHQVPIPGTENWPGKPCDPDLVCNGDTFRLYFTGDPSGDGTPETHSAVSVDGISFALEPGVRFEVADRMVLDPSLLWTGDTLQYFAGGASPGSNWHAHSTDGLNFVRQADVAVDSLMFSNGIALESGFRFYGFRNMLPGGIKSVFSPDGGTWSLEPGWRLQLDSASPLEYRYVKDAAVVRADSGFIMYYVTRKRETGMAEERPMSASVRNTREPVIIRDVLWQGADDKRQVTGQLLDISGRKVLDLAPGANDVSRLAPGVYFVRVGGESALVAKAVVLD